MGNSVYMRRKNWTPPLFVLRQYSVARVAMRGLRFAWTIRIYPTLQTQAFVEQAPPTQFFA